MKDMDQQEPNQLNDLHELKHSHLNDQNEWKDMLLDIPSSHHFGIPAYD
jgi:hypothetical protein